MICLQEALDAIGHSIKDGQPLRADILSNLGMIMQDKTYAHTIRQHCFKAIAALARKGQSLPDAIYLTMLRVTADVSELDALRKISAFVLMTSIADRHQHDAVFTPSYDILYSGLVTLLEHERSVTIKTYLACTLPYVMRYESTVPEFLPFYLDDALREKSTHAYAQAAHQVLEQLKAGDEPCSEHSDDNEADFQAGPETMDCKPLNQLFDELLHSNAISPTGTFFTAELESGVLRAQFEAVLDAASKPSRLLDSSMPINQWEADTCLLWSKCLRTDNKNAHDPRFMPEILAVFIRTRRLLSHQSLRDVQILALLILLNAKEKGRIAEIATGEGKTAIIALCAAFYALQGKKVDVLSSSSVLAHRDAKAEAAFYNALGITVADTNDPVNGPVYFFGTKACYLADVVYGDVAFQWDTLRTEYQLAQTRGTRPYDVAIVDEVDSMLIEEGSKLALVGGCQPNMEQLQPLLVALWARLHYENTTEHFIEQGGRLFWQANKESAPIEIHDRIQCLEQILTSHVQALISDKDSPILVPNHLKPFALAQATYWAQSAVMASETIQLNKDYVLSVDDKGNTTVAPIDFRNTGVTQLKSAWTNGLHQFLQIKHGLALTPETLTTSFISNRGYLSRYGHHVLGVTGTLGGEDSQSLLTELYLLDLVFVPTFKVKQLQMMPGILAEHEEAWVNAIVESAKEQVAIGRAVLILCETNLLIDLIEHTLKTAGLTKLRRYGRSDLQEQNAPEKPMESGEIMVATSLGARGTNIKLTDSVKRSNGLHVCFTYLANKRGRDQGFGRAARDGEEGSAQIIVNKQAIEAKLKPGYFLLGTADSLEEAIAWQDKVEAARLEDVKHVELKKIKIQEDLFVQFSQLRMRLRTIEDNQYRLADLEERWGFWLKNIDNQMSGASEFNESFFFKSYEQFEQSASSAYLQRTLQNPGYWVSEGNRLSPIDSNQAIAAYHAANALDPVFAFTSHYALARHYISRHGEDDYKYKAAAVDSLNKAKAQIQTYLIPQTQTTQLMYAATIHPDVQSRNGLLKQYKDKEHLLEKILENIAESIWVLEQAPAHIRIDNYSALFNLFYGEPPETEIAAFCRMGLTQLVHYEALPEEKEHGFFDAFLCAAAGIAQIVVGVCLTLSGQMALGGFFISEGLGDILFSAQAVMGGQFNWKDYGLHKQISVAVSAVCWGIDSVKASIAAKNGRQVAAQRAASKMSRKALVDVAKTQVTRAIVSAGIREVANGLINAASRELLAQFKEEINAHVQQQLADLFCDPSVKEALYSLLTLDKQNNNQRFEAYIQQSATSFMTKQQSRVRVIVSSVIDGVLKRQAASLYYLKTAYNIAEAITKVTHFCDDFANELGQRIRFLAHKQSALQPIAVDEAYCQARSSLLLTALVSHLKQYITRALHQGVVRPICGTVLDQKISEFSDKVCNAMTETKQSIAHTVGNIDTSLHEERSVEEEMASSSHSKAHARKRVPFTMKDSTPLLNVDAEGADVPLDSSTPHYPDDLDHSHALHHDTPLPDKIAHVLVHKNLCSKLKLHPGPIIDQAILVFYSLYHNYQHLVAGHTGSIPYILLDEMNGLIQGLNDLGHSTSSILIPSAPLIYKNSLHHAHLPSDYSAIIKKITHNRLYNNIGTLSHFALNGGLVVSFVDNMGLTSTYFPTLSPSALAITAGGLLYPRILHAAFMGEIMKGVGKTMQEASIMYQTAFAHPIIEELGDDGLSHAERARAYHTMGHGVEKLAELVLSVPPVLKEFSDTGLHYLALKTQQAGKIMQEGAVVYQTAFAHPIIEELGDDGLTHAERAQAYYLIGGGITKLGELILNVTPTLQTISDKAMHHLLTTAYHAGKMMQEGSMLYQAAFANQMVNGLGDDLLSHEERALLYRTIGEALEHVACARLDVPPPLKATNDTGIQAPNGRGKSSLSRIPYSFFQQKSEKEIPKLFEKPISLQAD